MNGRDYKQEILLILSKNGGHILGFNNLQKIGNFHSTSLQNNLVELEQQNKIKIIKSKVGRRSTQISLIKSSLQLKSYFSNKTLYLIKKLKKDASYHDVIDYSNCMIQIAFSRYKNLILAEIASDLLDRYPMSKKEIISYQKDYREVIESELVGLEEPDRRRIINSMFDDEPDKKIINQLTQKLHSSA